MKQQKTQLDNTRAEMPPGKIIKGINLQEGETLESVKLGLINDVIKIAESSYGNTLIYVKPLGTSSSIAPLPLTPPKPPALPPTAPAPNAAPNTAPNAVAAASTAPPEISFADAIDESTYEIAIRGTYTSINDFTNKLAKSNSVIQITKLDVIPDNQTDKALEDPSRPLKATMTISCMVRKL
jgi:hypothetical protein